MKFTIGRRKFGLSALALVLLPGCLGFGHTPNLRLFNNTGGEITLQVNIQSEQQTIYDEEFRLETRDGPEREVDLELETNRRYTLSATTDSGLSGEHDWQVEGKNHGVDVVVDTDGIVFREYWMD